MKIVFNIFFAVFIFSSCINNKAIKNFNDKKNIGSLVPQKNSSYFPRDSELKRGIIIDSLLDNYYSKILFSLNEPSLFQVQDKNEKFIRLLILNTRCHPVTIRVNILKEQAYAIKKQTKSRTSMDENEGVKFVEELSSSEKEKFLEFLNKDLKNYLFREHVYTLGKDGINWILESYNDGKYSCINNWDNGDLSTFKQLPFLATILDKVKFSNNCSD